MSGDMRSILPFSVSGISQALLVHDFRALSADSAAGSRKRRYRTGTRRYLRDHNRERLLALLGKTTLRGFPGARTVLRAYDLDVMRPGVVGASSR